MDIPELGAIGELVGGVAVIVSLVFVGLQVRHSNRLAQGAAELEMGRMNMDYLNAGVHGDFAGVFSRCYFTPEDASTEDKQRFIWSYGRWFHMIQAMYRQYQHGILPEASWNPLLVTLANVLEDNPIVADVWESNGLYLAEDFRQVVNEMRPKILAVTDRCDEALQVTREGHRLDPFASRSNLNLGVRLRDCGQVEEARSMLEQFLKRNPTDGLARVVFASVLAQLGEIEQSINESRRLMEQYPDLPGPRAQLAWAYALAGNRSEAMELLDEAIEAGAQRYLSPFAVARVHSALRDRDASLEWLERAYGEQDYFLSVLETSGDYRWLDNDPAFHDLIQRIGLS